MGRRIFLRTRLIVPGIFFLVSSCAAQTNLIEAELETVTVENLRYYLYFPQEYTRSDSTFPLLLFLHGGGESGSDLEALKTNGPPRLIAEGKQFPFLILAPQNPHEKMWWNIRAVMNLLDKVISEHRVDQNRVYLTGLSRGGSAAWELAVQYPERFAAMAVVCGMAPAPYAHWINKNLPIWVFHGTEDPVIPFNQSEEMVEKLREMGYNVKFTIYEGVGHESWIPAYGDDALYDWFVNQERKN